MANAAASYHEQEFLATLPKQVWYKGDPLYQLKGFWFRTQHLLGTQRVLKHFEPQRSDVILASFPKTGTTWMKSLLHSIVNRSSGDSLYTNHPHDLVPFLELQLYGNNNTDVIVPDHFKTSSSSTRIFSTHIPYQLFVEKLSSSDCKVVYVTRNPKDMLVSLLHFVMSARESTENFSSENAADLFCKGGLPFGPYYDHVLGYWNESLHRPDKFFFITYEELKKDPKTHVRRLAEFLKCPFNGDDEEQQVDDIVKKCSFENLSNYDANKSSDIPDWVEVPYNSFFRQGKVGDHKNYLQEKDVARIDAMTREKFYKSGYDYGI